MTAYIVAIRGTVGQAVPVNDPFIHSGRLGGRHAEHDILTGSGAPRPVAYVYAALEKG